MADDGSPWPVVEQLPVPRFDEDACTCPHLDTMHDDGFGCTMPECDCLAGWSW